MRHSSRRQTTQKEIGKEARLLRRRDLMGLLGTAGAVGLAGCSGTSPTTTAAAVANNSGNSGNTLLSCVVRPSQTEGPYFVDELLNRSDIRTDPTNNSVRDGFRCAWR